VTQELIDNILCNELRDFAFPVKPVYNPRISDNGRIVVEIKGVHKTVKRIEIGRQDGKDRRFLLDTLLHEYYEADIAINRHFSELYWNLDKATPVQRHKWINARIAEFFKELEG